MSDQKADQRVDQKAEYAPPPVDRESRPLPKGWVKQFDSRSNAWFYVDTNASPPRSIWVHPYDDPQYLESHPDAKRHDDLPAYERGSPSPPSVPTASRPLRDKGKAPEKRGFLGKLKDKAIGTKEEREAAKLLRKEERRKQEQERQERWRLQQEHLARYGPPPQVVYAQEYPGSGFQQGGYPQGGSYPQQGYPQGYPPQAQGYPPQAQGYPPYGQVYSQPQQTRGGGMAMPLLGGLAGGLLLGDMLGGGFGGDGGF